MCEIYLSVMCDCSEYRCVNIMIVIVNNNVWERTRNSVVYDEEAFKRRLIVKCLYILKALRVPSAQQPSVLIIVNYFMHAKECILTQCEEIISHLV